MFNLFFDISIAVLSIDRHIHINSYSYIELYWTYFQKTCSF